MVKSPKVDPYEKAHEEIARRHLAFTPRVVTEAETRAITKPPCYEKMADPADPPCQGCRILLPCLTSMLNFGRASYYRSIGEADPRHVHEQQHVAEGW